MFLPPFQPINYMSSNYCLKEKNMGEIKKSNNHILIFWIQYWSQDTKIRSWRTAEDLGYLDSHLDEESGGGRKKTEDNALSRGQWDQD